MAEELPRLRDVIRQHVDRLKDRAQHLEDELDALHEDIEEGESILKPQPKDPRKVPPAVRKGRDA